MQPVRQAAHDQGRHRPTCGRPARDGRREVPVPKVPVPRQEQELPPVARQQEAPRDPGTQLRAVRTVPL